LHTITAGAFYDGCYAVITLERDGLKVTFKKLEKNDKENKDKARFTAWLESLRI